MTNDVPFFDRGLRFSCRRCSRCCRHEPGYVALTGGDVANLCALHRMEPETFIAAHCRRLWRDGGEILALKEKSNYDCVFWQEGCTVYQVRPLQCRTYPFWSRILASRAAWDAEAAECPGMNHGELHSADEIRSLQF